ncbi:hypothetical protein [Halalkalibacter krulwichiae]|uniref:ABM domain-containing protein n=1 Tax=Halalkalibacter krulwichiae TaxID=199441 RepID=A0A1X9M881_9BACI|nr:hypothetical protein [Halalkalibacter krulwichiae]ARK29616.1 hypothetical protein BkAM31D_06935 [Halalkalibacter krulwichiae]
MYYARLVQYQLGRNKRLDAERITQKLDKISRTLSGFRGNVYFFDDTIGEYRALNYWDTKLNAQQAHKVLCDKLESELQLLSSEKPTYKLLEVYDPPQDEEWISSHIQL